MSPAEDRCDGAPVGSHDCLPVHDRVVDVLFRRLRRGDAADLAALVADTLLEHPDFHGCEVVLADASGAAGVGSGGHRCTARMPAAVCGLLASEALPTVLDLGCHFVETCLHERAPQLSGMLLGVPIRSADGVVGGMLVWNRHAQSLRPAHGQLLGDIADLVVRTLRSDFTPSDAVAVDGSA